MISRISALFRFGNNHEGSIPFTRSMDNQGLVKQCSKSAVNASGDSLPPHSIVSMNSSLGVWDNREKIGKLLDGFCGEVIVLLRVQRIVLILGSLGRH